MTRPRRLPLWIAVLVGAALTSWWVFHVPFAPERMFRTLPLNTAYVSVHRNLAGRWDAVSKNPLTQSLFRSLGIEPAKLRELARDPAARIWLDRLASHDLVVAYVPELGRPPTPAWVLVGWLGGQSQRLRWQLAWGRTPGFTPQAPHRGWRSWIIEESGLTSETPLTVALLEGVAVGVLSAQPTAISEILDTFDGLRPSLTTHPGFPGAGVWCQDPQVADRGWLNLPALGVWPATRNTWLAYEWSDLQPDRLSGCLCGPDPFGVAFSRYPRLQAGRLDALLGDTPQGLVLLSSDLVLPLLESADQPAWLRLFGEILRREKAGVVMLGLLGDEFSGRLKGLKLPTLLAGLPVEQESRTSAWMLEALDRLNAQYRWGLVPREVAAGTGRLTILEGTSTNVLASLPPTERPAYAVRGGWLLLASNAQGLSKLVDRFDQYPAAPPKAPPWSVDLLNQPVPACAWLDLARAGKTLRLALSTWSLKLLLEDPRATQQTRQRLNEARAWVDSLMPLQVARLWLRSDGQRMEITFQLGD